MVLLNLNKFLILSRFQSVYMWQHSFAVNSKLFFSNFCILDKFVLQFRPNISSGNIGLIQCSSYNINISLPNYGLLQARPITYKKKSSKGPEYDSDSDDSDDDFKDDSGSKVINVKVNSLRTDVIIKSGLGMARNKVEEVFYQNNLRVNGKKIQKKSQKLHIDDEVDVIKGVSPMNSNFLSISRLVILSAKPDDDQENLRVKLRKFKTLYIEDYENQPWKKNQDTGID